MLLLFQPTSLSDPCSLKPLLLHIDLQVLEVGPNGFDGTTMTQIKNVTNTEAV